MMIKPIIKLSLTFLVPFIALLVLIPTFFRLELNNTSVGLLMASSLFIMFLINVFKKIGHIGSAPLYIGLALMGLSGLALYSSVSINGSEKMIELDARSQGYVLIGVVVGFVIFVLGAKSALNFAYGWGNIRGRR